MVDLCLKIHEVWLRIYLPTTSIVYEKLFSRQGYKNIGLKVLWKGSIILKCVLNVRERDKRDRELIILKERYVYQIDG